ncbi:MAG: hypothetical protein M1837_003592 [Sclerophora amabilis]|nr:MAG: hypothetical protein M1837_003592 [Sclerophora amabilis]
MAFVKRPPAAIDEDVCPDQATKRGRDGKTGVNRQHVISPKLLSAQGLSRRTSDAADRQASPKGPKAQYDVQFSEGKIPDTELGPRSSPQVRPAIFNPSHAHVAEAENQGRRVALEGGTSNSHVPHAGHVTRASVTRRDTVARSATPFSWSKSGGSVGLSKLTRNASGPHLIRADTEDLGSQVPPECAARNRTRGTYHIPPSKGTDAESPSSRRDRISQHSQPRSMNLHGDDKARTSTDVVASLNPPAALTNSGQNSRRSNLPPADLRKRTVTDQNLSIGNPDGSATSLASLVQACTAETEKMAATDEREKSIVRRERTDRRLSGIDRSRERETHPEWKNERTRKADSNAEYFPECKRYNPEAAEDPTGRPNNQPGGQTDQDDAEKASTRRPLTTSTHRVLLGHAAPSLHFSSNGIPLHHQDELPRHSHLYSSQLATDVPGKDSMYSTDKSKHYQRLSSTPEISRHQTSSVLGNFEKDRHLLQNKLAPISVDQIDQENIRHDEGSDLTYHELEMRDTELDSTVSDHISRQGPNYFRRSTNGEWIHEEGKDMRNDVTKLWNLQGKPVEGYISDHAPARMHETAFEAHESFHEPLMHFWRSHKLY